ncbi:MAG: sialate O-acetylesterase [Cyclobacteriaceae bacterium]|nr:sialate O-acetylesterase [Cyclobacteriaceae bacterium]
MKRQHILTSWFLFLALCFGSFLSLANVKVAQIFSDHMVLQRNVSAPVWGTATPGEKIIVEIQGMAVTTLTGKDGRWKVYLPPFEAGGPYVVTIRGNDALTLTDVMFGDVWVASGQSNMAWKLENAQNGAEEIEAANYPDIRMFYVPRTVASAPKNDLNDGQWDICTPEIAKEFSAVAYFFGKELHQDINVPIGLINCNWGGTAAEAWTSTEMLKTLPDFEQQMADLQQEPNWEADMEANRQRESEKNKLISTSNKGLELGVTKINYNSNDWPVVIAPKWKEDLKGIVWMRKVIEIPSEFKGQEIKFDLGRIDNQATVYFNEQELGTTGSPRFAEFTVPAKLVKSGKNVIAVRLLHRWGTANFAGPEDRMKLYAPNGAVLENLAGPWKYLTGLEPDFPQVNSYQNYPSSLFNGMVNPIIPYGIKGVIWYQGESNAGRAYQYQTLFPAMIQDWRVRWGLDYFPFLYVQLANYMDIPEQPQEDDWAELREAQLMALRLPNTGMAVTIDIGEMFDIHPRNKQEVGHRLALAAKSIAYDQDLEWSGPLYRSMVVNGRDVEITFDHVGKGLQVKGDQLEGFQIAGKDKKFYWAEAQIVGGKVFVTSDKVTEPVAVRYAWAINPKANLYNKNGLPASPFRTDDWPGKTRK